MSLRALIRLAPSAAALILLALPSGASAAAYGSRTLRIRSHGADVKRLQANLGSAGHRVARDGEFGPRTLRALRATERELELRVDGVATRREQRAIRIAVRVAGTGGAAYMPPPPPEQMVPGEDGQVTGDGFAVPPRSAPKVVKDVIAAGNAI